LKRRGKKRKNSFVLVGRRREGIGPWEKGGEKREKKTKKRKTKPPRHRKLEKRRRVVLLPQGRKGQHHKKRKKEKENFHSEIGRGEKRGRSRLHFLIHRGAEKKETSSKERIVLKKKRKEKEGGGRINLPKGYEERRKKKKRSNIPFSPPTARKMHRKASTTRKSRERKEKEKISMLTCVKTGTKGEGEKKRRPHFSGRKVQGCGPSPEKERKGERKEDPFQNFVKKKGRRPPLLSLRAGRKGGRQAERHILR